MALSLPLQHVPQTHRIAHRHLRWLPGRCRKLARRGADTLSFVKGRGAELLPGLREHDWVPSSARNEPRRRQFRRARNVVGRGRLDQPCKEHIPWFDTADDWPRHSEFPPGRTEELLALSGQDIKG